MPFNEPDATDPMTLHGVMLDVNDDEERETLRAMAVCFAEEFARTGYRAERIMFLFQSPIYHGPHMAYEALGAEEIAHIIAAAVCARRPRRAQRDVETE